MKKSDDKKKKALVLKGMEQDRQRLLMKQPFIGMVLMHLELVPVIDEELDTAATDGTAIYMNCIFYAKLDLAERLFVMAHEVYHCIFMHFARLQTRNPQRFNYASDLEIHFALKEEKMKEPFVLPHDFSWRGLSAEEIYEKLEKRTPKGNGQNSENIVMKDGNGFDNHDYKGDSEQNKISEVSQEAKIEHLRQIIIQVAQQIERTQGFLPNHLKGIVEKLQKPELDWRTLLRNFVTQVYGKKRTWLPPNRRYVHQGLYLQANRSELLRAVLAIDTSASTCNDLSKFFAELVNLLNSFGHYEITIIQCDCKIQKVETFSSNNPPPLNKKWEGWGYGGTSFIPVFEYLKKENIRPEILIYITDGDGQAPILPPPFSVLWVLTEDGEMPSTWGQKIKLSMQND